MRFLAILRYVFFTACALLFFRDLAYSQCNVTFSGSYLGNPYEFNTYEQIMADGKATDFITLQYSLPYNTNCPGWKLKVRADGNFTNGSVSVPAAYVSLAFNRVSAGGPSASQMGASTAAVSLSTGDVTLINSNAAFQAPPDYYVEHKFDMIVKGGNHLSLGPGTYTATLVFSLYNQSDQLMSSINVQARFVVNFSNACTGAALNSYSGNSYTFNNYTQQMAGATATDAVSVQYNPNAATCRGWSLKVRAGNFTNGSNSIAPQHFSLRFNRVSSGSPSAGAIGVSSNPVVLGMADANLISNSNAGFTAYSGTEHKFDMLIQGGYHLLLPNGTYSGTLFFSLFNQNNQLVSTTSVNISVYINSSSNSYTLQLQNGAADVSLSFNSTADYLNGVSNTRSRGLKITGYNAYQIIVKTTQANMQSSSGPATIPVSAVSLETTLGSSASQGIATYTRALSASDQVIITNPLSDWTQQVLEFNLKYYTAPGDTRFYLPPGVFTTNVLFVAVPH